MSQNTPFALVCSLYTQNGAGLLVAGVHMLFVRPNMLKHCSSPPMLLLMLKTADYAISNASRMGQALILSNINANQQFRVYIQNQCLGEVYYTVH